MTRLETDLPVAARALCGSPDDLLRATRDWYVPVVFG